MKSTKNMDTSINNGGPRPPNPWELTIIEFLLDLLIPNLCLSIKNLENIDTSNKNVGPSHPATPGSYFYINFIGSLASKRILGA